jgi:AraC-like DNA-binding protein
LKSHFSSISSFEEFADKKSLEHGLFLKRVHKIIEEHLDDEEFKLEQLYTALGLSRTQLYRKLKPLTKMSPAKYLIYYRLQKAKSLLQDTTYNVSQVVSMVGFSSHSYFTRAFNDQFGMNPSNMSKSISTN